MTTGFVSPSPQESRSGVKKGQGCAEGEREESEIAVGPIKSFRIILPLAIIKTQYVSKKASPFCIYVWRDGKDHPPLGNFFVHRCSKTACWGCAGGSWGGRTGNQALDPRSAWIEALKKHDEGL